MMPVVTKMLFGARRWAYYAISCRDDDVFIISVGGYKTREEAVGAARQDARAVFCRSHDD